MPRSIVEREIPGAGQFALKDRADVPQKSCDGLHEMGPRVQLVESLLTADAKEA